MFGINIYTNHKFHKQLFQRFVFGRKPGDKSVINLILKKIRFLEGKFSLWLLHQTNQKKETKQCHKSPALRKSNRHWPVLFRLERSNAPFWDQIFFLQNMTLLKFSSIVYCKILRHWFLLHKPDFVFISSMIILLYHVRWYFELLCQSGPIF